MRASSAFACPLKCWRRSAHAWAPTMWSVAAISPTNASTAAASVDDAVFFGVEFARANMDFISTSRGGKFDDAKQPNVGAAAYPYTGPSGYECMPQYISDERGPFGRNTRANGPNTARHQAGGLQHPARLQRRRA